MDCDVIGVTRIVKAATEYCARAERQREVLEALYACQRLRISLWQVSIPRVLCRLGQ